MEEPAAPTLLASALTEFIKRHEPGSRMYELGHVLLTAHGKNRDRRAAVLKHEDLAKRVTAVLGLRRADHWTGYIPAAVAIDDDGGMLRLISNVHAGQARTKFNELGRRGIGSVPNNTPQRAELVDISTEAWHREHPDSSLPELAKRAGLENAASATPLSLLDSSSDSSPERDGLT